MPKTSHTDFQLLRQKIYEDPALQARLFECLDSSEFTLTLQEIAGQLGLALAEDTVRAALHEGSQGWHGRLLR